MTYSPPFRVTLYALFFAGFLTVAASPVVAQELDSRADTEKALAVLEDRISEDIERLESTKKREEISRRQLGDLNDRIERRERLLIAYTRRIDEMRFERDSLESSIDQMEREVSELRESYQERARHAYQFGRLHDIALILSAESINQMLIRVGYLRRFSNARTEQLNAIQATGADLADHRTKLQHMLVQTEMLKRQAAGEQSELADLKKEREREIARLRREQVDISEALEEKRSIARDLTDQINAIIAEEARRARAMRTNPTADAIAGAARERSTEFAGNRGRLPWPADGVVAFPFGEIVHPEYGTKTPNPGILIDTDASAEVHAVHGGIVNMVDVMPELGRYVIIDHGDYHTVYGNFSMLYVGQGDTVEAEQLIGRAGTETEPKGEAVFFGVFKDGLPVDPAEWLAKSN